MEEDDECGQSGRHKTHPVWNYLDNMGFGPNKKALYKCRCCGTEKEGLSATRWAVHILGRAIGNSKGILACVPETNKLILFKEAKKDVDAHVRGTEAKQKEAKKQKTMSLDSERARREIVNNALNKSHDHQSSLLTSSGNFQQRTIEFGAAGGQAVPRASGSQGVKGGTQQLNKEESVKLNHAQADTAVARMFYETGFAMEPVEHPAFVNMVDVLSNHLDPRHGRYRPPTRHDLSNNFWMRR
jgi:hypothetical protein